jgi:hypothetical protein
MIIRVAHRPVTPQDTPQGPVAITDQHGRPIMTFESSDAGTFTSPFPPVPRGVTLHYVDESTGDIYDVDEGGRLMKRQPEGEPIDGL